MISYEDLDLMITVINKRIKNKKLDGFESEISIQKVVDGSQVIFINQHFCNQNLKQHDKSEDEDETKDQILIKEKDNNSESFGDLKKRFEKEHPQSIKEIKQHEKELNQIKAKVERRKYNKMVGNIDDGFGGEARKGMQQFHTSLAFGTSFITLMFLGFILGFYIGKYAFGFPDAYCYIISLIIGILTMMLETILYIIKVEKIESNERKKEVKAKIRKFE